jgi:hypothetical protein
MNLQERKDKTDIISKEADIVYKKTLILIAAAGGSGTYAISQPGLFSVFLFVAFGIFAFGIGVNYFELVKLKKEIEGNKNGQ